MESEQVTYEQRKRRVLIVLGIAQTFATVALGFFPYPDSANWSCSSGG
ncbi:MAG: hypothetical protein ABI878_02850 [Acidobacteriota bacterium]